MSYTQLNPVSIIIPIKNRSNLIPNLIKNLIDLDYPKYEIIIVNDGSIDNTKDVLKNYQVKSINLENSVGSAKARNLGIEQAKYDIIALTDSDCFVSKNWLKNLVPYLNYYDVVGGKVRFCDKTEDKLHPFNSDNVTVLTKNTSINFLNTCNMVFKKGIWEVAGGFLNYRIEDLEFSWRLLKKGFKLCYTPKGLVLHHGNRNPFQNIKKYLDYGKSYSEIAFIHKMSFIFKSDKDTTRNTTLDSLLLIFFPFLFLIISLCLTIIIKNVSLTIFINILLILSLSYLMLVPIKRIDLLFKIYRFTIGFGIVVFSIIYFLKKQ
ncbi:MAG: glycosyltransferase [Candidatus Hermodarchaeota archaeon]